MQKALFFITLTILFSSCGLLNQSVMFKTPPGYQYDQTPDYKDVGEYKISANDIITFNIYSNNGLRLIDFNSIESRVSRSTTNSVNPRIGNQNATNNNNDPNSRLTNVNIRTQTEYVVDANGYVKLPIVGQKKIAGLTIRDAESMLEESYSSFYLKPFVVLFITNRNVIFFKGDVTGATTVPLQNENTTLIQFVANQGGISEYGKAHQMKLIRNVNNEHEVYHINLSTIKGVDDAHIVLQANDIIYVEPRKRVSVRTSAELAPIMGLISSLLLSIVAISSLN